jgi:hypothetical protein
LQLMGNVHNFVCSTWVPHILELLLTLQSSHKEMGSQ